jgi:diguanylate cyclase (GGDEF)-like protein
MESWDEGLEALRSEYLREAVDRLAELRQALGKLRANRRDLDALAALRLAFHGFHGSGRTYGFNRVTDLGREAEEVCKVALGRAEVSFDDIEVWQSAVDNLTEELSHPGARADAPLAAPAPQDAPVETDILVVDDDAAVAGLLAQRLTREGYGVRTAATLESARRALAERLPDAIVSDVMLPDGLGFDFVEELRSAPGGDLPVVIIVSVRSDFVDRVEAIHCGADAYFEKPVDWDELARRLRSLLDAKRIAAARILSIEDDPHQAAFLRSILESAGYEVRICAEPRAFDAEVRSFRPDLVLMDVNLPGASGYDLVRYLRQDESLATLPVLVLTAENRVEARVSATRAGADDFLAKPVSPGLLLSVVAARVERARWLQGLLERDGLTGLHTHSAFLERARAAAARLSRNPDRSMAWVMIDVDHFKSVNDRYGHPTGDRVLARLGQHLRRRLRQSDTAGRYGGEEFAALVEDLGETDAVRLFERLRAEFEAIDHRAPSGEWFRVTFSVGVAPWRHGGDDVDAWRQRADDALYAAKCAGRNRVALAR